MYIKIIFLFLFNAMSGEQIYIHHKISIFIDSIISIIFTLFFIDDFIQKYIYIPLMLYCNYCYALYLFLVKYINTNYYVSVFILETLQGIFLSIYCFIVKRNNTLIVIFNDKFYIAILHFLFSLIYNYSFFKAIEILSPIHPVLTFLIGEIFQSELLKNKTFLHLLLSSIFIFSTLMYLEIIELNFLELNKNYKKKIIERSKVNILDISSDSSIDENDT